MQARRQAVIRLLKTSSGTSLGREKTGSTESRGASAGRGRSPSRGRGRPRRPIAVFSSITAAFALNAAIRSRQYSLATRPGYPGENDGTLRHSKESGVLSVRKAGSTDAWRRRLILWCDSFQFLDHSLDRIFQGVKPCLDDTPENCRFYRVV